MYALWAEQQERYELEGEWPVVVLSQPTTWKHTLDISVEKKQVTSQQRSQHSQQNYHKNLGLRKTLHPPKSTRLKLP